MVEKRSSTNSTTSNSFFFIIFFSPHFIRGTHSNRQKKEVCSNIFSIPTYSLPPRTCAARFFTSFTISAIMFSCDRRPTTYEETKKCRRRQYEDASSRTVFRLFKFKTHFLLSRSMWAVSTLVYMTPARREWVKLKTENYFDSWKQHDNDDRQSATTWDLVVIW